METDEFLTIKQPAKGLYKEKGSKFYGIIYPVKSEEEIKDKLEEVRATYHDARHHCYAYRYGIEKEHIRMNDDGEPSSTAGKPIFGQIQSHELTNILIVVVRYFGGTKLGTSGLIRAYKTAAEEAINKSSIIKKVIQARYMVEFDYGLMNEVMKFLHDENLTPIEKEFGASCKFTLGLRKSKEQETLQKLKTMHGLTISSL